ncbi:pyridoxamine 5'-phosphate oxidase family protein [Actinophytocola sp.]|uniref:pyridoxamine 5'-phosphate oxidase family protein n=1 Tax=Actinophytocola sp. TaxID=1872138 RepID=UPI002EDB53AF
MSSFVMTVAEREAFLAEVHIGVLAVARDGRGPLAVPVWYRYEPGGDVLVWMDRDSVKDRVIRKAGRFSLVAQTEELPYKYVSVEGPVVSNDTAPTRDEALAIAGRYLPPDEAVAYVDGALNEASLLVVMRPERWLSNDQGKS